MSFTDDHYAIRSGRTTERRLILEALTSNAGYPSAQLVAAARGVVRAHALGLEPRPHYQAVICEEAPALGVFLAYVDDWATLRRGGIGQPSIQRWTEIGETLIKC